MRARYFTIVLIPVILAFLGSNGCVSRLEREKSVFVAAPFLGEPGFLKVDFEPPAVMALCGESLPLELPAVKERFEAEFLLAVNHQAQVRLWQRRAKRFFPAMEAALKVAGLPDDLKYLAVAESDLRPRVFSPAGAAGIWQFIPTTARRYGLKVNKLEDQRLLAEPSLVASLKYLTFLRDKFGGWALAMAAYNAGEARIVKAIAKLGQADYYQLRLPRETERYVYRIAAIKAVLEQSSLWGLADQTPLDLYKPWVFTETKETFDQPMTWANLAQKLGVDYKDLRSLNPHLAERDSLVGGPFLFRVPKKT
ncbi:MAG: lytic transglycosylase domain-containing protein [Deltaproteobacteria bacterium]|jgi:hypothetical protein|nr:lytic transglycosylase domain-containing protein [Deltaproteobacteria bacterium]